jgi:hypothetical protein
VVNDLNRLPVDVTVRYLLPSSAPLVRTCPLPAHSRTTIFVNQVDAALAISEVSADISATAPAQPKSRTHSSKGGLMTRRVVLAIVCASLSAAPALAQTVRISESSAGVQGNGVSGNPSMSATGRYVAFESSATNLIAADTNDVSDIFVRDRDTDADGIFDETGFVSTTRVSVGPGGVQANGQSFTPILSADGRYITFRSHATNLVASGSTTPGSRIFRLDRQTGATLQVSQDAAGAEPVCLRAAASADARIIAWSCFDATTPVTIGNPYVGTGTFVRDMDTGVVTMLGEAQGNEFCPRDYTSSPTVSADGRFVAFSRVSAWMCSNTHRLDGSVSLYDRETSTLREHIAAGPAVMLAGDASRLFVSGATTEFLGFQTAFDLVWYDRTLVERVNTNINAFRLHAVSREGRYALLTTVYTLSALPTYRLYDAHYRLAVTFPWILAGDASFDQTSRYLAFATGEAPAGVPDTNNVADVFVADLAALYDADHDTLDDRDETFYGLSPTVATGDDGPAGDPDADGATNATEIEAGTHPRGFVKRYLAEGATSDFFRTRVALANPDLDPTHPAGAVLALSREGGSVLRLPIHVAAGSRQTINVATAVGAEVGAFSTVIESDRPLAIDRTMSWGTRPASESVGYGAHTESAMTAPSAEWYLAEGATGAFDLYYLLQNPQNAPVDVTVRYLLPDATPIVRTYPLPANSRTTIHVNDVDPVLAISEVSGAFSATAPILVERAMYASRPGQPFALGHAAKAVPVGATSWFLAEGATGTFFDTYVLIANPMSTPATIEARFDTADSGSVTRPYTVAANSRFTVLLDAIPGLEATSVSTTITSTNSVPVIVERAMYWPDGFANYYEGHVSAGSTTSGLRWVLGEGEEGGAADAQTYVLIANTGSTAGRVRVTPLFDTGAGTPIEIDLQPNSRTTVRPVMSSLAVRFGALVESIGATPAPIVVEGAFYWTVDGVTWAAGSGVVATRLP